MLSHTGKKINSPFARFYCYQEIMMPKDVFQNTKLIFFFSLLLIDPRVSLKKMLKKKQYHCTQICLYTPLCELLESTLNPTSSRLMAVRMVMSVYYDMGSTLFISFSCDYTALTKVIAQLWDCCVIISQ